MCTVLVPLSRPSHEQTDRTKSGVFPRERLVYPAPILPFCALILVGLFHVASNLFLISGAGGAAPRTNSLAKVLATAIFPGVKNKPAPEMAGLAAHPSPLIRSAPPLSKQARAGVSQPVGQAGRRLRAIAAVAAAPRGAVG
jgi:hypothetical protein